MDQQQLALYMGVKLSVKKKNNSKHGFGLLELVFFISILSIVLVASIGFTIRLVFAITHNRHKLLATHYAQEVKEWLNGERESNWEQFQNRASIGAGTTYCINQQLNLAMALDSLTTGVCGFNGVAGQLPNIYRRRLTLIKDRDDTASRINALIEVSWQDEGMLYSETIETLYSFWE